MEEALDHWYVSLQFLRMDWVEVPQHEVWCCEDQVTVCGKGVIFFGGWSQVWNGDQGWRSRHFFRSRMEDNIITIPKRYKG